MRLKDTTQNWLSFSDAVVREHGIPENVYCKSVSDVQDCRIQSPPCS